MIEYLLVFVAGFVYALIGINVAKRVRTEINIALAEQGVSAIWGVYAAMMVTLLWPFLGFILVFTTAYATLRGIGE